MLTNAKNPLAALQVAHLFLTLDGGPKRLPRPSEVLFCDDKIPEAEVEAFLWRSRRFPQLLFVLVEPNRLPPDGKKQIAEWLTSESPQERNASFGVILTSPWYIPASAQVCEMRVRPERAVQVWRDQCPTEVLLYHSEPPRGTGPSSGPSSGKSSYIRHRCKQNQEEIVSCILHEGFQLNHFIEEARRQMLDCSLEGRRVALHIEVTAYSDWELSNAFLRHLLLCQVLYDPASGQMASLPDGTRIHVEIGCVVGKRDLHSLRPYATQETMQARFPQQHKTGMKLTLLLLYPILEIVGRDVSSEVLQFPLQEGEQHYLSLQSRRNSQVHVRVTCDSCGATPILGICHTCQVCPDFDLCADCYYVAEHPNHAFRQRQVMALPFRLMQAFLHPHPLDESRRLSLGNWRLKTVVISGTSEVNAPAALRLDVRPFDMELLASVRQVDPSQIPVRADLIEELGDVNGDIDLRRLREPHDAASILQVFAVDRGLPVDLSRAQEDVIIRRVAILGDWMVGSHTFRGSDGRAFVGLASLLMTCMGVNLQKLAQGEEACMHFVVPYTQHAQEDFLIFVPSLVQNPLQPDESVCSHGPDCDCNQIRLHLLDLVPDKVFLSDPAFSIGLLPSAEEDERQGIEALSLAFGIPPRRLREIFEAEGYILTRDFACIWDIVRPAFLFSKEVYSPVKNNFQGCCLPSAAESTSVKASTQTCRFS